MPKLLVLVIIGATLTGSLDAQTPQQAAINQWSEEVWLSGPSGPPVVFDDESIDSAAASMPDRPILAPKALNYLTQGQKALTTGRYEDAKSKFECAYKLAPGNPDTNLFLGIGFLELDDFDNAALYLTRSDSIDPGYGPTQTALSILHLRVGNSKAALDEIAAVLHKYPKNYLPHLIAAQAYLQEHLFKTALQEAREALHCDKKAAKEAELTVGEALAGLGLTKEAIEQLSRFVSEAPESTDVPAANKLIGQLEVQQPR